MMDDATLIARVIAGNAHACRFLVDKYRNLVWHMVLRMLNQREDAEDICQEVFFRVFRDAAKFRGDAKLSTWIGSITYNICVDYLRKRGKEIMVTMESLDPLAHRRDDQPATDRFDRQELKNLVHRIIGSLPLHYRTVVTLYHLEGFSYREIEETTGMPEGTVKSYLNRARGMIREKMVQLVPDIDNVLFENR